MDKGLLERVGTTGKGTEYILRKGARKGPKGPGTSEPAKGATKEPKGTSALKQATKRGKKP